MRELKGSWVHTFRVGYRAALYDAFVFELDSAAGHTPTAAAPSSDAGSRGILHSNRSTHGLASAEVEHLPPMWKE